MNKHSNLFWHRNYIENHLKTKLFTTGDLVWIKNHLDIFYYELHITKEGYGENGEFLLIKPYDDENINWDFLFYEFAIPASAYNENKECCFRKVKVEVIVK